MTDLTSSIEEQPVIHKKNLLATRAGMAGLWLIVIAVFWGLTGTELAAAQKSDRSSATSADKPRPVLKVDKDQHRFGEHWVDEQVKHSFTLTNAGDAPLVINRVHRGCGSCTRVGDYKKKLAPGDSTELPVSMINRRLNGQYRKRVTVYSNDPEQPKYVLTLYGDCKWHVGAEPKRVYFGLLLEEEPKTKTVRIVNHSDKKLELSLGPQAHPDKLDLDLEEVKKGQEYKLKITVKPPYKPGYIRENLLVYTNLKKQKKLIIPVYAKVPHRLEVVPHQLVFSKRTAAGDRETQRRILRVSNYGDTPVKVLDAEVNDPAIELEVRERKAGENYTIVLTLPGDYLPPAKGRMLTIKTDDKEKPVLRVPIRRPNTARNRVSTRNLVGKPAPHFALETMDEQKISKARLADAPAVINVIAINCSFCKKQMPKVEQVRKEYADKGVKFITIVERKGKAYSDEEVENVLQQMEVGGMWINDKVNKFSKAYRVRSLPTLIVLDKTGKIKAVTVGAKADIDKRLQKQLDDLLKSDPVKQADASAIAN
jgi:thiol-disulfide isomerase/thioredoxin